MTDHSQNGAVDWHALSPDEALSRLESRTQGLSPQEVEQRLERYGPNRLKQQQTTSWWKRFLEQFNNLLMLILLVAAGASLALGQVLDAAAILGVVLITALIGLIQEGKAEQALESIRDMLSPRAQVIRDGKRRTIDAEALVPGDIVTLQDGDRVPADLRLFEARQLRCDEAPLTGESTPVDKSSDAVDTDAALGDRHSMAYSGTLVVHGSGRGLVVETGEHTEIGRISQMLRGVDELKTPLLKQLDRAGRVLALSIIAAAAFTAAIGIVWHGEAATEMFMAAVALAVAAIPQGLPAIVTITLALGVRNLARRNAIIRRLPAVETLGSISTIFSDKTGTLTCNEMTAQALWLPDGEIAIDGVGFAPEGDFHAVADGETRIAALKVEDSPALRHFLEAGVLCNDAGLAKEEGRWQIQGDPTEGALVVAAAKAGLDADRLRDDHVRQDAIPFDSEHKYMATLHHGEGAYTLLVKGAPDRLLAMCRRQRSDDGDQELDRETWEQRLHELSSRGLRVLALAEKTLDEIDGELTEHHVEKDLVLLGLVGLFDPPREAAMNAVKRCLNAGIRPVMVTGDHAVTARAIAERLGFAHVDRAISGHEIEAMSDEELKECIQEVDVFARVAPEHKLRLVEAMQARGGVCAMTGDGVNDGPALKRADVGVAMGIQGTEAAKEAAEMVLADDNFATIAAAIEEGRKTYDNIRKTITFILPANGGQGLSIMLAVIAGVALPITPLQALWVNMVVAVTLGMALAFEKAEPNIMRRPPRDPAAPLLDLFLLWRVVFVSVLLLAGVFGMFAWIQAQGGSDALARAGAVNMLVMGSAAYLINSRLLVNSTLSLSGLFGGRPIWGAIAIIVTLQLGWTYLPFMQAIFGSEGLSLGHWGVILAGSLAIYLIVEMEKRILRGRGMGGSGKQSDDPASGDDSAGMR
ncbi:MULTISPECIES: cation-translocating P-type ATPase [Halomonas]|uniref:Ca2+-transporting ATPase n=1 Tax=Halomonas ventosae TaxID=229007 RepID=A0A4R6HZ16_9GAMM|nr:HAD-IC family P-type ATPase [Halomonas ventosae]TDO13947.1 Ca2+-transporting ATPase [Halomonas ventosae]